jgi:hypothetical protein
MSPDKWTRCLKCNRKCNPPIEVCQGCGGPIDHSRKFRGPYDSPEQRRAAFRVVDGGAAWVLVTFRSGSKAVLTPSQYKDGDGLFAWTPELRSDVLRAEILGGAW